MSTTYFDLLQVKIKPSFTNPGEEISLSQASKEGQALRLPHSQDKHSWFGVETFLQLFIQSLLFKQANSVTAQEPCLA